MSTAELTALLLFCTAATFTPGPNTALSTALAANLGLKRAFYFVLSVPVGWGLLFSLCASGVGAMVVAMPVLRVGIQAAGVLYLLWLAFKVLNANTLAHADAGQLEVSFMQGVLLQFLNIKAWMLALTVAGGWLAGHSDSVARFALILPILLLFGLCSNLTYALAGTLLRQWLADPEHAGRRLRRFNRCMATVLVITAAWMATF
jgi:threonine/homoserine/homoserine lactone efflux protein